MEELMLGFVKETMFKDQEEVQAVAFFSQVRMQ